MLCIFETPRIVSNVWFEINIGLGNACKGSGRCLYKSLCMYFSGEIENNSEASRNSLWLGRGLNCARSEYGSLVQQLFHPTGGGDIPATIWHCDTIPVCFNERNYFDCYLSHCSPHTVMEVFVFRSHRLGYGEDGCFSVLKQEGISD